MKQVSGHESDKVVQEYINNSIVMKELGADATVATSSLQMTPQFDTYRSPKRSITDSSSSDSSFSSPSSRDVVIDRRLLHGGATTFTFNNCNYFNDKLK